MGSAISQEPAPDYRAYDTNAMVATNPAVSFFLKRSPEEGKFSRHCPPSIEQTKKSCIELPMPSCTGLTTEALLDRIGGTLLGNTIGDAVGLATEFMNHATAAKAYGKDIRDIKYTDFEKDAHRARFPTGDWTDDSDQMICILDSMLHLGGEINVQDIAFRILYWCRNGYPELGDVAGLGLGFTVGQVLDKECYLEDPHRAAHEAWEDIHRSTGRYPLANGAVMRTSILGIPNFHKLEDVCENARQVCWITHYDPRCVASCVAVNVAIAVMLQGIHPDLSDDGQLEELVTVAYNHACRFLGDDQEAKDELHKYMFRPTLEFLNLDEGKAIGYTFKCMGSGFYALWSKKDFKTTMMEIIMEAGDADTNGAVAGAMLGCKVGYRQLPRDWLIGMPNRLWFEKRIVRFLGLLGLTIPVESAEPAAAAQ